MPPEFPLRLNMRKTLVRSARGTPGPLSLHGHLHQAVATEARGDGDRRVRRRVAGGVVEKVGEHLADEEVVDVHERQVVGRWPVVTGHVSPSGRVPRTASATRSPTAMG